MAPLMWSLNFTKDIELAKEKSGNDNRFSVNYFRTLPTPLLVSSQHANAFFNKENKCLHLYFTIQMPTYLDKLQRELFVNP